MNQIDLEEIGKTLRYDPDTGVFTRVRSGKVAGCITPRGYRSLYVNGRNRLGQSVAWFLMRGEWPPAGKVVDHINRDPSDNRWVNLRLVPKQRDNTNRGMYKNNKTGFRGVSRNRMGFESSIKRFGQKFYLGTYRTAEEASETYERIALMFSQMEGLKDALVLFDQMRMIAKGPSLDKTEKEPVQ